MAVHLTTSADQLAAAVSKVRHSRHHPDCRCGVYRKSGAPYCSTQEWQFSNLVDRILSAMQRGAM